MVCWEKKSKVVAAECGLLMWVWTGALSEEIMSLYNDSSAQWWCILLHPGLQSRTNARSVCVCAYVDFSLCAVFCVWSWWEKGWISMNLLNMYHSMPTCQCHLGYISVMLLVMILCVFCLCECLCAWNYFCGFVFVPSVESTGWIGIWFE